MTAETKVGFFLIAALSVLLASAVFLGDMNILGRRAHYAVDFEDAEALPPKAAVKISGVEIGKVSKVELIDGRARVKIAIDPSIELYDDAHARIGSTGIIGTRFVDLEPGTPSANLLTRGSVIQGQSGAGLNEVMKKVATLFDDEEEYGEASDNFKAILFNIRKVTDSLNTAMGDNPQDIKEIVHNIKDFSESAKIFGQDLREITQGRKEDIKVALAKFRSVTEKLDAILGKIERGEGTIGALVSDEKTATEVKEAVTSLSSTAQSANSVFGRFTKLRTYWNYRLRYDARDDEAKSDAGVTIVPRKGKFYAFGVTNIGQVPSNEKYLYSERKNRITAVLGGDYGPFTGYGGAIRSRGGVGLNFRPLWKFKKVGRRFELNAETYDFDRDKVVRGEHLKGPNLDAGGHIALTRWLWVGARGEDLLERPAFVSYANLIIGDEDLAYLLGFIGLAR